MVCGCLDVVGEFVYKGGIYIMEEKMEIYHGGMETGMSTTLTAMNARKAVIWKQRNLEVKYWYIAIILSKMHIENNAFVL